MKIRNYIYTLLAVVMVSITSCKDQFDLDLLDNPNAVTAVNADIDLFFNSIQGNFQGFLSGLDGRGRSATRIFAMTSIQYQTAYTANGGNGIWSNAYANILPDIAAMTPLAEEANLWVHVGAAKIIKAWTLMGLVDMFGDIPYSEAGLGVAVPSPVADGQRDVYAAALALLDEGIADVNNPDNIGAPAIDNYMGTTTVAGAVSAWTRLGNTLKLRYYLTTRLDNANAGAINAILASGDFIQNTDESFAFQWGSQVQNPNSQHPGYVGSYNNPTGSGPYISNDFMLHMRLDNDPRIRYYFYRQELEPEDRDKIDQFTLGCRDELRPDHYTSSMPFCLATTTTTGDWGDSEGYWGRDHGNGDGIPPDGNRRTERGIYPVGGIFDADQGINVKNTNGTVGAGGDGITPHMMSFYVDFMRAEAALTMGTSDDARAMFEAGMQNSIDYVIDWSDNQGQGGDAMQPTAAEITVYVNSKLADYDAANDAGKLDLIIREYQKASWGAGFEIYNAYRRTGFPSGLQFTENLDGGDFPRTMFYPGNYVDLNQNATQRNPTEQVFWDTNPAGFIN